jgi:hypothetical protein
MATPGESQGLRSRLPEGMDREDLLAILGGAAAILGLLAFLVWDLFPHENLLPPGYQKFRVVGVFDDRTLKVEWLEKGDGLPCGDRLGLKGIWSDRDREPASFYRQRREFLASRLIGRTVRGGVHIKVVSLPPPNPQTSFSEDRFGRPPPVETPSVERLQILEEIDAPSEVLLEDGTSLNELLLAQGYAVVDFTDLRLSPREHARYAAAEAQARAARRGLWNSAPAAQAYTAARERYKEQERLRRSGTLLYVLAQVLLAAVILVLRRACRSDPVSFAATSKLLAVPGALVSFELLRWIWTRPFPKDEPSLVQPFIFGLLAALAWGAWQTFLLVAYGPVHEWQALWTISRAKRVVLQFFAALWSVVILFGFAYAAAGGAGGFLESMQLSLSETFHLGQPLAAVNPRLHGVSVAHAFTVFLLLALYGVLIPPLKDRRLPLSLRSAITLSLSSFLVLALVVASVFANLFYFSISFGGFQPLLDRGTSFLMAAALAMGFSYEGVHATSAWTYLVQIFEAHISFFLQIVALRFIFSSVDRAQSEPAGEAPA